MNLILFRLAFIPGEWQGSPDAALSIQGWPGLPGREPHIRAGLNTCTWRVTEIPRCDRSVQGWPGLPGWGPHLRAGLNTWRRIDVRLIEPILLRSSCLSAAVASLTSPVASLTSPPPPRMEAARDRASDSPSSMFPSRTGMKRSSRNWSTSKRRV